MGEWKKDGGNKENEYCKCAGATYKGKMWVSKWCNKKKPNT